MRAVAVTARAAARVADVAAKPRSDRHLIALDAVADERRERAADVRLPRERRCARARLERRRELMRASVTKERV